MSNKIGTPTQALRYMKTLVLEEHMAFLSWYDKMTLPERKPGETVLIPYSRGGQFATIDFGNTFRNFCKANPDPVPDWFGKFDEQVITDCMNEALGNSEGRPDGAALLRELESTGLRLVAVERERGDGRKAHYGPGEQPWDTIKKMGWGPEFAAGNVIKYLRRDKELESSGEKARVYFGWLKEMAEGTTYQLAPIILRELLGELSPAEMQTLNVKLK